MKKLLPLRPIIVNLPDIGALAWGVLLLLAGQTNVLWALPSHGLALYGPASLKYQAGQHFAYANPNAPKGGALTLGEYGAFTKLNPASLKGALPPEIAWLVWQSPMSPSFDDDEPLSQYANLAASVDLAPDRLSLTYIIREDARFADGYPVTADDFIFSFSLMRDAEYHPALKSWMNDVDHLERADAHTVKFYFKRHHPTLPLLVGQLLIFPRHIYGAPGKSFGVDFDNIAIGSGPYVIDRFEFGKFLRLKRNPRWWGKDLPINRGLYNFDMVTWRFYQDPVALREAFKAGEFDVHAVNSSRDWALDYQGSFLQKGYYLREEIPHRRVAGMQGFVMNQRRGIFRARAVRAALALALDFEWSNKNLFYGQYTRNTCYFDNDAEMKPQGAPAGEVLALLGKLRRAYGEHVPLTALTKPVGAPGQGRPIEENLSTANTLLDNAGWEMGRRGLRTKDGQPLTFELLLDDPEWMRIAEPYINNLRRIGVSAEIRIAPLAEYEERLRRFDFDMIAADYAQTRAPGVEQRLMWGSKAARTPGSLNYAGITNPAIDDLIEAIIQAPTRRHMLPALQAMDRILTHQFYIVPHWFIAYERLVYWNKFGRSAVYPAQNSIIGNALQLWWQDGDKADQLAKARAANIPLRK